VAPGLRLAVTAAVPGVHFEGFVTPERLRWLYRCTAGLVFPALYEGFGIPVVEAMRCGAPVLTSARGATRESAGGAAVLVDPFSVDAIADGIDVLLRTGDELRCLGRAHAARFTWERTAALIRDAYADAIG
jgi:glycosyltransferase involved in cell wall biosynthesis